MNKKLIQRGFTLLELLVVFVIIAILATIAIPAYSEYVKQSKVAEATSTLSDMRIKTEQFFQDNRTYVGAEATACAPTPGTTQYFDYNCVTGPTTYTITANGKANHQLSTFQFTINQDNLKTSIYEGEVGANCWLTKKGGTCS
jgi:type IV pilus assembly protein PilE